MHQVVIAGKAKQGELQMAIRSNLDTREDTLVKSLSQCIDAMAEIQFAQETLGENLSLINNYIADTRNENLRPAYDTCKEMMSINEDSINTLKE